MLGGHVVIFILIATHQSGNVLAIGLFTPALRRLRRDCMGRPTLCK